MNPELLQLLISRELEVIKLFGNFGTYELGKNRKDLKPPPLKDSLGYRCLINRYGSPCSRFTWLGVKTVYIFPPLLSRSKNPTNTLNHYINLRIISCTLYVLWIIRYPEYPRLPDQSTVDLDFVLNTFPCCRSHWTVIPLSVTYLLYT